MKFLLMILLAFTVSAAAAQTKPDSVKTAPKVVRHKMILTDEQLIYVFNGLKMQADDIDRQANEAKQHLFAVFQGLQGQLPKPAVKDTVKKN